MNAGFCQTFKLDYQFLFSTLFLDGRFPIEDTFDVLTRFVIGDVMGLVVVLFLLIGLLKLLRRFASV